MKKLWMIIIVSIVLLLGIMAGLSWYFSKDENAEEDAAKQPPLKHAYSVTGEGKTAYVTYDAEGNNVINVYNRKSKENSTVISVNEPVVSLDFSTDGETLYYATNDIISNRTLLSHIYSYHLETQKQTELLQSSSIIMEMKVGSKDNSLLYYRANSYEDMGGITGRVRSDFQAYRLHLNDLYEEQLTSLDGKEIKGIAYTNGEDGAYVSVDNNIIEIPFENPENSETILTETEQVYDLASNRKDGGVIYSMPGKDGPGTYKYELYYRDSNGEKTQLTENDSHTGNPILLNSGDLYYMVDTNFGKGNPSYVMYKQSPWKAGKPEVVRLEN
ncbi:hypothetical protein [Sediminibacillus albus]|uniref:DUF5050 domain-containing protein n=1 Tax=Sediminibacillus albus TaxID=407036 RepID=A0A1G9C727_9BACI|nr:hypothetical protein [Sediminibacillus albus]SDK47175.1 hypothetical protein SAMN05216243_3271 [Sediminibacillus albus]